MTEITTPITPTTDAEYAIEAERLLAATKANLAAMQESRQRSERIRQQTKKAMDDVFRTLDRMATRRAAIARNLNCA